MCHVRTASRPRRRYRTSLRRRHLLTGPGTSDAVGVTVRKSLARRVGPRNRGANSPASSRNRYVASAAQKASWFLLMPESGTHTKATSP